MRREFMAAPRVPQIHALVSQYQAPPLSTIAPQALQGPPSAAQMPAQVPQYQALPLPTIAPQALQRPPSVPQIPAQVPQYQAPPPPIKSPQALQRPPAQSQPTPTTASDRSATNTKTVTASAWKSTAGKTRLLAAREQLSFTMATATVALCLVVWMLATVVYLTRQNVETSTTDTSYETESLGDSEGQTSSKQTTIAKPQQPTSATNTHSQGSPSAQPSPPETTTSENPKADREPLVCTMGERLTSKHQFPPDGLCNYIFYDSLYKEGDRDLLPDENTYTESLNTFLNYHRDYRHTTLGVGFAFNFLSKAEQDLKVRNPSPLEAFWKRGIFHAGVLDPPTRPTQDRRKAALATVKKINRLLDTQRRRGHTAITAIALPQPDIRWTLSYIEDLRELRFTPNLVILFGHYRIGDNLRTNCAIMPPTRHPDDTPPDELLEDYGFDVATAVPSLRKVYDDGVDTRGIVSVTLKGRWAEPQVSKDVDFFKPCVSDINIGSFGRITDVCPGGGRVAAQLNYSTKHHAMIAYISYLQRTFVYDDERALAEKLCRAKSVDSSVSFGIAAYDIDFEDYENRCTDQNRNGAFSRLKALRKVVDYFNRDSASFNGNACETYVMT